MSKRRAVIACTAFWNSFAPRVLSTLVPTLARAASQFSTNVRDSETLRASSSSSPSCRFAFPTATSSRTLLDRRFRRRDDRCAPVKRIGVPGSLTSSHRDREGHKERERESAFRAISRNDRERRPGSRTRRFSSTLVAAVGGRFSHRSCESLAIAVPSFVDSMILVAWNESSSSVELQTRFEFRFVGDGVCR